MQPTPPPRFVETPLPAACREKFAVERVLDSGGFGTVYLAEHRSLRRKVALKLLHTQKIQDPGTVDRFLAEARITATLIHPHIVVLLDHGFDEGVPWIAYEFLEGRCLREILKDGPIAWDQAFKLGIQIASALEVAHSRGIVHRDVKPANVLESASGHFKLTDFGIAKWLDGEGVHTQDGIVVGSPVYASPEQILGKDLGPHSDIYSLGILLYQCVTETVPFFHINPQVIFAHHLKVRPPAPSTRIVLLPPAVDDVILKAIEKRPEDRFPTATAMRETLVEVLGTHRGTTVTHLRPSAGRGLRPTPSTIASTAADASPHRAGTPGEPVAMLATMTTAQRVVKLSLSLIAALTLGAIVLVLGKRRTSSEASPEVTASPEAEAAEVVEESRPSKIPTALLAELSDQLRAGLTGLREWDGYWDRLLADVGSSPMQADVGVMTRDVQRVLKDTVRWESRISAVAEQVARPYEGPARMPTLELTLWARALAYQFVGWTRVERLTRMATEFARAAREGRTSAQEIYLIGSQVRCDARGLDLLRAYFSACAAVMERDLAGDGLRADALVDALDDEFLVSQTIVFTHWDQGVGEGITGEIGRFKARLQHLQGPDVAQTAGLALAFWEWGRSGAPRGDVRADLAHAVTLAQSLARRHPEERRALDNLTHKIESALALTHPQGH